MKKNWIVFTLVVIISITSFSLGCRNDTKQNDTNPILRQNNVTEHFVFTLPLKIKKK